MQDRRVSVFLVVLIFSTCFNPPECSAAQRSDRTRGGAKYKSNERRVPGLVPYPRIGRSSNVVNLAKPQRLIHYPRVGRSVPMSDVNCIYNHDGGSDPEFAFYNEQDVELDSSVDQDYEARAGYLGKPRNLKYIDRNLKDSPWLMPDHAHTFREFSPGRMIDGAMPFYPNVRGPQIQREPPRDYIPKLGREDDQDVGMSYV